MLSSQTPSRLRTTFLSLALTAGLVGVTTAVTTSSAQAALASPSTSYVLSSAIAFDGQTAGPTAASRTVTLPARLGAGPDKRPVVYVVTESSDARDAQRLGVNYAPKLANALGTAAVQRVTVRKDGTYAFAGTVDFSPRHVLVPGPAPQFFPPADFAPGAVADKVYTPLTTTGDGIVRNTPHLANATGVADTVTDLNPRESTATLTLIQGFYGGHAVQYIRTEASDRLVAAVEDSTYAPNLAASPGLGSDDPTTSAREAIVPVVNGQTGLENPQRQGLNSALAGEGSPLNIIQEEPADPSDPRSVLYSPVWDVSPVSWTGTVRPTQLRNAEQLASLVQSGQLSSAAQGPFNPSLGVNASGAVSLCPVVAVLL